MGQMNHVAEQSNHIVAGVSFHALNYYMMPTVPPTV